MKGGGKVKGTKSFTASEVLLPHCHCWTPYDDSHQNHNCLHCCHCLILPPQVFNLKIDLFQVRLSFQQRRQTSWALFIKLLIGPQAKAASLRKEAEMCGLNFLSIPITTSCHLELATKVLIQMHSTTWTIQ